MRRILELDGIRAIAITAVMACHYAAFSTMLFKAPEFGWVGVELFFVLSGFLITTILLQLKHRPHPYKIFYLRRILRIFPPYFGLLLLILLIAELEHDSMQWGRVVQSIFFLQSFSNTAHVFQSLMHTLSGAQQAPNLFGSVVLPRTVPGFPIGEFITSFSHTWSLSVEEWFYILWAPLVLRLNRRPLIWICTGVCAAGFFMRWFGFLGVNSYFVFFSRIDVLLGGALLALWFDRRRELELSKQKLWDGFISVAATVCGMLVLGILFVIKPVFGYEIRDSVLFSSIGLPLVGFAFAGWLSHVIRHAGTAGLGSSFLRLRPMVALGTVSYTLYLVHVPVYFLVTQASKALGVATGAFRSALVVAIISTFASILIARLSFRYFEMPILSYKDKLTERLVGSGQAGELEVIEKVKAG